MSIEKDSYGKPVFASEVTDPTTGVTRRVEKSILSEENTTIFRQKDTFPTLGIVRTITRSSHLRGDDLPTQILAEILEEEIRITKIDGTSDMFNVSSTKYTEAGRIDIKSLSFSKPLGDNVRCAVFYNGDGKISDIFIESDSDIVKEDEELDMVEILFEKDGPYFYVIDGNQPIGQDVKNSGKIEFLELFGSKDFTCMLEDSYDRISLHIEDNRLNRVERKTVSISKQVDAKKLYGVSSADQFAGWEDVLKKVDSHFSVS
ncbi:MAG: hypothetical protein AAB583_05240 [Patescibacteria group bacterium]